MIPLPLYAKIKDCYCISYLGNLDNVLLDLKKARPIIEKELPGIQIYICCNDDKIDLFKNEKNIILKSEIENRINELAYYRELKNEKVTDILEESKIPYNPEIFSNNTA